jgi:hypothetical protein
MSTTKTKLIGMRGNYIRTLNVAIKGGKFWNNFRIKKVHGIETIVE